MTTYTVHVPDGAPDHLVRADRTAFVREGFSLWGFLFAPLFFLRHRLWLATALWLIVSALIVIAARKLQVSPGSLIALSLLMHLFAGVEGNDLRRWGMQRRGFSLVDIVSGPSRDDAERAFFQRQPDLRRPSSVSQTSPPTSRMSASPSDVIGMFPDGAAP